MQLSDEWSQYVEWLHTDDAELWFFDHYIIPLAKKLKDCGVFGAASDECLKYAQENRKEWEAKGEEIVERLVSKHAMPL